jgi:hypothetical protein
MCLRWRESRDIPQLRLPNGAFTRKQTRLSARSSEQRRRYSQRPQSRHTKLSGTNWAQCEKGRFEIGPKFWCERGDSNPHGFTRQILSLVRLPIPPLSHG